MKPFYLLAFAAALPMAMAAQGTITFETAAPVGTSIRLLPNTTTATMPVTIDCGNGIQQKFTIDPSQMAYTRWIETTVEGPTITISGPLTELTLENASLTSAKVQGMENLKKLELSHNELTDFELLSATPLTELNLSFNKLVNSPSFAASLSLEQAASTLRNLNLSSNENLTCLNISSLEALQYLTISDCPDLGSIFVCQPEESRPALKNITAANCDLGHFYPVSLPSLTMLDLSGNALLTSDSDDPFVLGDYPSLTTLNVSDNIGISELDITGCTKLEKFIAGGCSLSKIDVSKCPKLFNLSLEHNKIKSLDLGACPEIYDLNVAGNPLKSLATRHLSKLSNLNISHTDISVIDLLNAYYLQTFSAADTKLAFADFNGVQPARMRLIDLRDCPNFTRESMAYTVKTLPQARTGGGSLLLEGSNAQNADIAYATTVDMQWTCDVTGDGTSQWAPLAVTLADATDSGETRSGVVNNLYPNMGYDMPYDLKVYQTTGGKFILAQWQPEYFQTVASVTDQALSGVPMYVYPYPAEGKRLRSITVNGHEITDQWFMISEPSEIKINFAAEQSKITITVENGQNLSLLASTTEDGQSVWVDWGTGERTEYADRPAYRSGSDELAGVRIEGSAAADKVTIFGDIAGIDLSGFGDAAEFFGLWDNHVLALDAADAPDLKYLNLYWNPVTTLDLSANPSLEFLNVAYTALTELNLKNNNELKWLEAYSDGFADPDQGIATLSSIDLENLTDLQYLDVKNNELTNLDLTKNPALNWLFADGNALSAIDLSNCQDLIEVNLNDNALTALNLTDNEQLQSLSVAQNPLKELTFGQHNDLHVIDISSTGLKTLDIAHLPSLSRLHIHNNALTAEELNEFYYSLPAHADYQDAADTNQPAYDLAVMQGGDSTPNEALRADSSIATFKGWTPSHAGSNGGCQWAFLDINDSENGTFTVKDAAGNVLQSGAKVEKYSPLVIEALPAENYHLAGFTLNETDTREGDRFDMPGIYTRLSVNFQQGMGITDADNGQNIRLTLIQGGVLASGNGNLKIFTHAGSLVIDRQITAETAILLPAGTYIALTDQKTHNLLVK